MDFARQQRDPTRHVIGIALVILIHLLVIYALLTGLGSKAIQLIKKPLNATIIEEIKAPPPPPPPPLKKIVEPPKIKMAQPFVPPPDIPPPAGPPDVQPPAQPERGWGTPPEI
jgi:protein TonB